MEARTIDTVLRVAKEISPTMEPEATSRLVVDLCFDELDMYEFACGIEDELHFQQQGLLFEEDQIFAWKTPQDAANDADLLLKIGSRARSTFFKP
jgi:hypothetical protein